MLTIEENIELVRDLAESYPLPVDNPGPYFLVLPLRYNEIKVEGKPEIYWGCPDGTRLVIRGYKGRDGLLADLHLYPDAVEIPSPGANLDIIIT